MKIYKISSLTIVPNISEEDRSANNEIESHNLRGLCWDVSWHFSKNITKYFGTNDFQISMDTVVPDGFDNDDALEGIVNFYLDPFSYYDNFSRDQIEKIEKILIDTFMADKRTERVQIKSRDSWGDWAKAQEAKWGESQEEALQKVQGRNQSIMVNTPRVIRLFVKLKDLDLGAFMMSYDPPPSLNLANNNAFYLLNTVLGFDKDYWDDDKIKVDDVLARAKYYLEEDQYEGEYNDPTKGVKVKDKEGLAGILGGDLSGRDAKRYLTDDQIKERLGELIQICNWAKSRFIDTLIIG